MAYLTVTANDEASLRAQVAAAVAGDYVVIPPGTYALTSTINITVGVKIIGSGATGSDAGPTVITCNGATVANCFTINTAAAADYGGTSLAGFELFDCRLSGSGGATAGISFAGSSGHRITGLNIQGCDIFGFVNGIKLAAANLTTGAALHVTVRDSSITGNSGVGIWLINCTMSRIERCDISTSGLQGILAQSCPNLMLYANAVAGNNTTNGAAVAQCSLSECHAYNIVSMNIDSMPTASAAMKTGVEIAGCVGGVIQSLQVTQSAFQSNSVGVSYTTPLCKGHVIDALITSYVTQQVSVDSGVETPFMRAAGLVQLAP